MSQTRLLGKTPSMYLPGGRVAPEVGKVPGEPVVDFIQCQLPAGGFEYRLQETKMCLRSFWSHCFVNMVNLEHTTVTLTAVTVMIYLLTIFIILCMVVFFFFLFLSIYYLPFLYLYRCRKPTFLLAKMFNIKNTF